MLRRRAESRLRKLRSDESGWSLPELMVFIALMGIVAAVLISFLLSSQQNLERQASRTISNDEIRLAVQSFDREVRSGNVVYDPSLEAYPAGDIQAGMSLRVYSQTNGDPRCVQWRITADGNLERRSWPAYFNPSDALDVAAVKGWRVVASNITNRAEGVAAFSRSSTNIVNVVIRANNDATKGSNVEIKQSVSGRNTLHFPTGSASEVCGPAVPDPSTSAAGRVPSY